MKLSFDLSTVDFRTTPLENLFLQTYLPLASGPALKVYLYGWKTAYQAERPLLGDEELAQALDLTNEEVVDALAYWVDQGLVVEDREEGHPVFRFQSMLLLYAGLYDQPGSNKSETICTGAALSARDAARKAMIDELEAFLSEGRAYEVHLRPNEIVQLQNLLDTYPIAPAYFLYAYKKASELSSSSSRSFPYVTTIVENWMRFEGICDQATLDEFLEKEASRKRPKKEGGRSAQPLQGENVTKSRRMSRKERKDWVSQALETSRKRSLKGDD